METKLIQNLTIMDEMEAKVLEKKELYRLLNLENKQTIMDKKTLERNLNKLQKEGLCKCISFADPSNHNRITAVIMHPSVDKVDLAAWVLQLRSSHRQPETFDAMKINRPKIVCAKLLHGFLWDHVTGLPGCNDAIHGYEQNNSQNHSTCKLFEVGAAIKAMPLDLFLQVVGGSTLRLESMVDKCRYGLCLSDLPIQEYIQATACLTDLIMILINLKLIQCDNPVGGSLTTLRHSLELKPCVEEDVGRVRHKFVLATRKSVDEYWNMLESCYTASDPKAAFHGSAVHELFNDKRQKDKLMGAASAKEQVSRSCKRKRSLKINNEKMDNQLDAEESNNKKHAELSCEEEQSSSQRCALSKLQSPRRKRFSWAQNKDRMITRDQNANDMNSEEPLDDFDHDEALNYTQQSKASKGVKYPRSDVGNEHVRGLLSPRFLHNISSPFPVNTGQRAVKTAKWLHERENELLDMGVDMFADLQCGDVLQLCMLIMCGEISMFPCLPHKGIGENKNLKPKISDSTKDISRKGKGFPGIQLSLGCSLLSIVDGITLLSRYDENEKRGTSSGSGLEYYSSSSSSQQRMEVISKSIGVSESTWEAMTYYARNLAAQELSLFYPDLFETVYSAIQKAGEQGLSMEQISQIIDVQGEKMQEPELIVEVLETFGCALKVNAYDSVHAVDSLYQSKYLLTSMACHQYDLDLKAIESCKNDGEPSKLHQNSHQDMGKSLMKETSRDLVEVHTTTDEVHHRVTMSTVERSNEIETSINPKVATPKTGLQMEKCELRVGDCSSCFKPILPWVYRDGTINEIVYKGLVRHVRHVLGIVMQNPGILEENLIRKMNTLNPQSCRDLLKLMILDSHIMVRKMYQSVSNEPPAMLNRLLGCSFKKPKLVFRKHLYANPRSVICF